MASEPLGVGLIGAGYFARFHADAWSRIEGVRFAAVAAHEGAAALASEYGSAAYEDARRLLDAERIDLLDIATPPDTHLDMVRLAAERGVDAICQKPLALTADEARAIVELAEAAGILLVVHENFRFQPWYREARRLIDRGVFGRLHAVTFRLRPGDGRGPDAYMARQPYFQRMERFLVHETAVHQIDTFRYLMGEVTAVQARLRRLNPAIAGEDAGIVTFDFESGAAGLFDGNRLVGFPATNPRLTMGEMWLEGEEARLRLDGEGGLHLARAGEAERPHAYEWRDRGFGGDCVFALQRHVVDHLRTGGPVENTGRAYLRDVEIVEAIYRSDREGRRILLD